MENSQATNIIIDWLLKFGIVLFLGSIILEIILQLKPNNDVWFWALRIILVVLFVGLAAIILSLDKLEYYVFGFFLVLIGSFYKIITIVAATFHFIEIPVYLLLIAVSIYFLTKTSRVRQHRN